jgi:hypothetical protein
MPVIEVDPVMGEPDTVQVDRNQNSNVIPFTNNNQPVQTTQQTQDNSQIDQFLAQYGIEFI